VWQLWLNFANKSTGELAWSPVALRIVGNMSRMATTLVHPPHKRISALVSPSQQVLARKDTVLLLLYALSSAINILLGVQFFIYR